MKIFLRGLSLFLVLLIATSGTLRSQTRGIGADALVLDDDHGHRITISSPTMTTTGPFTWTLPITTTGLPLIPLSGTTSNSTLFWNGTQWAENTKFLASPTGAVTASIAHFDSAFITKIAVNKLVADTITASSVNVDTSSHLVTNIGNQSTNTIVNGSSVYIYDAKGISMVARSIMDLQAFAPDGEMHLSDSGNGPTYIGNSSGVFGGIWFTGQVHSFDMGGDTIMNISDPIHAQDAATKNYVDTKLTGSVSGTSGHLPVFTTGSSIGNGNLSGDVTTSGGTATTLANTAAARTDIGLGTASSVNFVGETLSGLSNGVVHATAGTGVLASSLIVNADIAPGTIDLTSRVTGILPAANGGIGFNTSSIGPGFLLMGTGAGLVPDTLHGTASQVIVTNGPGLITLSTPQSIATTSSPVFAGMALTGTLNMSGAPISNVGGMNLIGTLNMAGTPISNVGAIRMAVHGSAAAVNTGITVTDVPMFVITVGTASTTFPLTMPGNPATGDVIVVINQSSQIATYSTTASVPPLGSRTFYYDGTGWQ